MAVSRILGLFFMVSVLAAGTLTLQAKAAESAAFVVGEEILSEAFEASSSDIAGGKFLNDTATGITWRIDRNGKLTVSGKGEFKRYYKNTSIPWYDYKEKITSAVVQLSGTSDYSSMFANCTNLTTVDMSQCNMSTANSMSCMFDNCKKLQSVTTGNWNTSKVNDLHAAFKNCKALKTLDVSGWNTSSVKDMEECFYGCEVLQTLDVSNWNTSLVTDMSGMFEDCYALKKLDVSKWNTAKVTDLSAMFCKCETLQTLNVSNWNTSLVKNMYYIFSGCKRLQTLDVSKWNTSNVTGMRWMFYGCEKLTALNVSGFNTSKATDMQCMFAGCKSLTALDVSKFDTSHVNSMFSMFEDCSLVKTLDVSRFKTDNVTDLSSMFQGCTRLTSLNLSSFNTAKVTDMSYLFYQCGSLKTLNLSSIRTPELKNAEYMFKSCQSLQKLDLSNFDMKKVEKCTSFLESCENLAEIKSPKNFPKTLAEDAKLPEGQWSLSNGKTVTSLPVGTSTSSVIQRNYCIVWIDYVQKTVKVNSKLSLKTPEPRTNSQFVGWYTKPDGKGTQVKDGAIVTGNMNIYSYWITFPERSDFVKRMYRITLGREADENGLKYWLDALGNGTCTGADLAVCYILSDEMSKRNLSNDKFVKMMYQAFFNRDADADGYAYWMGILENGMSRKYMLSQFVAVPEYKKLCSNCKISVGSYTSDEARDRNEQLTKYIVRCYTQVLGRNFDVSGLNYWANEILTGKRSAREAAVFFIQSPEFVAKNVSNGEYIKVLYRTFFGREYDQAGYEYWMGQLNSSAISRDVVLACFANSNEFTAILKSYGVQ